MASTEAEDLAAMAGFTVAFFAQDKSRNGLWQWFQVALKENWTGDRLLQQLRNTNWFKKHNAAYREAQLLRTSDPAEYKARVSEFSTRVRQMAAQLGIPLGKTALEATINTGFLQGWNDQQLQAYMARFKGVWTAIGQGQILGGTLGQIQTRLAAAVRDYGVTVSPSTLGRLVQNIAAGDSTEQLAMAYIQKNAIAAFPGLAEQIKAGQTVRDIAEPYVQTMAKTWEVNPEDIDLQNKTIRGALNVKGQKGDFSMMTIPDFETQLRKDPRWNKTDNAQDSMMQAGHEVLQQWGITW
jgi:hypothetical protein